MIPNDLILPADAARSVGTCLPAETAARTAAGARARWPFVLATFSGLAFATAFPPLSWSVAAWVALVPLLAACAELSPLRAAIAGMCWAAATAVGVASFLPAMLSGYLGIGTPAGWFGALAIAGGMHGFFVGGYTAWVAWLVRRRVAHPLLLAAGWAACEFARGALTTPWALTAYSQIHWAPLIQSADFAGPYAIGMLVAGVNACAAAWFAPALRGHRPLLAATTAATALGATLIYGQWRLGESFADGPDIEVAVVQAGATPAEPTERAARLGRYIELTRNGVPPGTHLIVWPEYAVESYLEEASPTRDAVSSASRDRHADLILGGPHYEASASGTRYHNSAYLFRDGRLAARYDKHRLVPFAEDDRLASLLGRKPGAYAPGEGGFVLPATALRVGTSLCFEAMFPDLARHAAGAAEMLVNLSNDAWFGDATAARHQLGIAALRAVENRRYLVRAAATGFSAVIDPHGQTLVESEFNAFQVASATVRASYVRTPYQRWGDAFAWIVIAGVVGATLRPLLDRTSFRNFRR